MSRKRKAKKFAQKHPVITFIVILLIVAIVGCFVLHTAGVIYIPFLDGILTNTEQTDSTSSSDEKTEVEATGGAFTAEDIENIVSSDVSIHFLEVGNAYTGDCTLIKVGDTEVLIDAGSRKNSAATIKSYVDTYCTDGVLEYVIATHAHQDHIAGFVGLKKGDTRDGIFYQYEIGTLIQFARSDQTSDLYGEYLDAVSYLEGQGTTVYDAKECWYEEGEAKKKYYLDESQTVSMNILYNYFYENKTQGGGGENEYSVCMLLSEESTDTHYLFTGDLEKKGEEYLVQYNPDLPKCKLFKAGHHGSYTASSDALLSVIQPEMVCVCCCCGNMEYADEKYPENDFPSQAFTDRVAKYTEQVFVTYIVSDNQQGYTSMNGNIVVCSKNGAVTVRCSNNAILFKDTEWFKSHRTWNG